MDKKQLIKEFTAAVKHMKKTKYNGTYYWIIGEDYEGNDWAIVLGWADGFEEDEEDDCTDGTWRICAKMAYQEWNNISQCDYDHDWLMPYDEESGEVDDNEVSIYPNTNLTSVVNWLLKWYEPYKNAMETMEE